MSFSCFGEGWFNIFGRWKQIISSAAPALIRWIGERLPWIYQYLYTQQLTNDEMGIRPLGHYQVEGLDEELSHWSSLPDSSSLESAKALLPPLLCGYLRAGAKVYGKPALDRDFRCADFFTVLKMDELSRVFQRKYAE